MLFIWDSIPRKILAPQLKIAAFLCLPDLFFKMIFKTWIISFVNRNLTYLLNSHGSKNETLLLFVFVSVVFYNFKFSRHNFSYFHHKTITPLSYHIMVDLHNDPILYFISKWWCDSMIEKKYFHVSEGKWKRIVWNEERSEIRKL